VNANPFLLFRARRERERLADEATHEQGRVEGREFIKDWRELRRNPRNNIPEGGLLPKRPTPPPAPPKPQGAPPHGGSGVKPPRPIVVVVIQKNSP